MKKAVLVLVLAALVTGGMFAQLGMSMGGGAYFDMSRGNGLDNIITDSSKAKTASNNTSYGGFVFFDAKFVEVSAGYAYGMIKPTLTNNGEEYKFGGSGLFDPLMDALMFLAFGVAEMNVWQLNISLLGKYPINLGFLTLYPLGGIEYNRIMAGTLKFGGEEAPFEEEIAEFSQFGILAGLGIDISLGRQYFIRAQGLFNLRLPNQFQSALAKAHGNGVKAGLGLGPRLKVGVGYRL
ncbi:MAG: hypothetical protein LBG94_03600 [Treponema sp.]|jgi:hypothetical protein|nr:hypothetical protein [Treponema sp.]